MTQPPNEIQRRTVNVLEALVIAALLALAGLIFSMREAVIRLQVTQDQTNRTLIALQARVKLLERQIEGMEKKIDTLLEAVDLRVHRHFRTSSK